MKKIVLILLTICAGTLSFSQDTTTTKKHNNEIGVDASPLLQQFFFFSQGSNYGTYPYYLMYRRHIKKWAIRAGVGGSYSVDEDVPNDTTVYDREISVLDFRLGIERKNDFSDRWQFFYGLDLWTNIDNYQNDYNYSNGGQTIGYSREITKYGVAPFLGFRFRISNRISLTTETNFQFYYYDTVNKQLHQPDESLNTKTTNNGFQTTYRAPTSLFFTFNF